MIFIEKMKNFKIYRTKTFLPTVPGDKKKGSVVLLMTPNYESSSRLMNHPLFVNNRRFESYYVEKDVSYYIGSKEVEEIEESVLLSEQSELESCLESKRSELKDSDFGVPEQRKFPLDTEKHVRSAVKFFNYVEPEYEEKLANNIIKAIKKFGITDINVSEKNRFSKYYSHKEFVSESVALDESEIPWSLTDKVQLYYYGWKYRTLSEKVARQKIFETLSNNLGDKDINSPDEVPTPDEYFKSVSRLPEESYKEFTMNTSDFLSAIKENEVLNTGDKILFFSESAANDAKLKRLLYLSRIRYRKDLINLLEKAKNDNKWLKYTYVDLAKYKRRNTFADLYFYNAVFYENNDWTLKKGMNLYSDLMIRLLNHPNLKAGGYSKKTIFIPINDWDKKKNATVWNFRESINPISCIYQMMFTNMTSLLKSTFGNVNIVFLGSDKYFKINFSEIDPKEIKKLATKLRLFCVKICKGEDFDSEDIDTSAENVEEPEIVATKIADKIELSKGVDITKQLYDSRIRQKELTSKAKREDNIKTINKTIVPSNLINSYDNGINSTITIQKPKSKIKSTPLVDDENEYINTDQESNDDIDSNLDKLANVINKLSDDDLNEEEVLDGLDTDEIKNILVSLGNDDEVNISASRSSRITTLDQELMDKSINGKSIRDILSDESNKEENTTTINVASPNKEEWSNLSFLNFDKNYNIDKDIVSIFRFFSNCSRPISIRDIKVEDNSTSEDRLSLYTVEMEDYRGKRFTVKLDIPIMEDNRFLLRGNNKSIQTQFFNMPIIKTDLGTCQLISNYKKIFLYRFKDNGGKSLPAVSKFIKAAKKYKGRKLKFEFGNNKKVCTKYQLPIDYIDLAGELSRIESDDFIIFFNQDEVKEKYQVEYKKGLPFLYNKKLNAIEYYANDNKTPFINILCDIIFKYCEDVVDLFDQASRSSVCAYSRASIMAAKIPVVILCSYHIGLTNTMKRANIAYEIVETIPREYKINPNKDWIEFNNGYIVYDVNYESSLLMNGLKEMSTEMYNIEDIDDKTMYIEALDNYGGRIKADGLDNFYDLFVDPMIKESLEYYHLPTDYIDILLYGNALLNDNKYIKHTDTSSRRLRRYQLISVYAYQVLSEAYGSYANQLKHNRQAAVFAVKQSAVIDAFLKDTISSDDSCINALRDVETTNAITTKGPSGMNADRAYSLDKRAYDESMVNVLGMSTGFAGNVGITRQATIDSNVSPEGYVKTSDTKDNMNDANTLTATESLIPFGSTRDDPMRTAMSFIQTSKHMVRTEDSDPLLVTSGADEVMPYLTTNKFAYKAKQGGIILERTDDYILVKYDDGSKDYINLKETIEKNSDGGYFVPLKLDASEEMKVNKKFKEGQILAYDKYSFSNSVGESNNIAYNIGKLAKIAIINSDEGFEDSGIISDSMAKKLATRVDLKFDTVIDKDSRVYSIAKIGDHVEAGDSLLVYDNAFGDENADDLMSALTDGDVSDLGKRKVVSEVTGKVIDIKIYRTVEVEQISESLQKIVNEYEAPLKATAKKLKENGLSISQVPAHYVLAPVGKLKRAQDALIIEFYVEYLDTVGVGDKIVYNSANKAVEKGIFPVGKEPYTDFRPNEKIDAFVSVTSINKRMVSSTLVYGGLQKLMVELDRSIKDIMEIPYDDTTI